MKFLYDIGIFLFFFAIKLASPFNKKAALFVSGRKRLLRKVCSSVRHDKPIIWFHCSSVGEFEQARPLIEKIRKGGNQYRILLTFFSPSGYELRKNYCHADWVFYLPMDTATNARRFVEAVKPAKVVFIKYEFWYNYLYQLKVHSVPTFIVSAIFRPSQSFFKWYGGFFRRMLTWFKLLFVQDLRSKELLHGIGIDNVVISGDTRFDRVHEIVAESKNLDYVDKFAKGATTWVAGSTWEPDEVLIASAMKLLPDNKLILVPHEVTTGHIVKIEKLFAQTKTLRYSDVSRNSRITPQTEELLHNAKVLIIDSIGILSSIYKYGRIAYIGGGFGVGIHNILEAASYGCPVIFGPNYHKFKEANDLIAKGGAFCCHNQSEFNSKLLELLFNNDLTHTAALVCNEYVKQNLGATQVVLKEIL